MMTTHVADSRLPADLRPVRLVARRDLAVSRVRFRKARYWHIKDPLSLRYYQLRDEEYLILRLLNGRRSLRAIKQTVDTRFAPRHLELPHLQAFLGRLHREGLTIALAEGQGAAMLRRARSRRRENWLAVLANPLAIRFRGLRSSRLFDWLHARTAWMFRPWLGLAGLLLIVAAFSWLLVHADTARHRFPDLQTMLSGRNVVWLALALTVVKVVHELAHGLTCRHFGARCHETGVMLLVFVPCLYCNVSDAWTIPSKWQRVAISGAGIGAELTLASLCTFLWWFSEPGLLNAVCLNVLVVCSVGTLLLNGNPLLRYDGYYMLADLLEIPNLQQEAAAQVLRVVRPLFMNDQAVGTEGTPTRRAVLLTIYGVTSALYRWIVVAGVLWICLVFFRAEGVPIVGDALIIMVVAGLLVAPVIRGASFLLDPRSRRQVSRRRLTATAALAAALALLFFFVPLPHRVSAPLVVEPANARPVYVVAPGRLDQLHVAVGSEVRVGQELAVFVDAELEQRIAELTGMRDHQRQHVANLKRQQMSDAKARDSLPSAEQLLASLDRQIEEQLEHQQQLTLRAPSQGTVLPPRSRHEKPVDGELPGWTGTLLQPENVGSYAASGTLFCTLGNAATLRANLIIDQADGEYVRAGQPVSIQVRGLPGHVLRGRVVRVSEIDANELPPELVATGQLPARPADGGSFRPYRPSFEAHVAIDPSERYPAIGATGRAKIQVAAQPLGPRLYRLIRRTFGLVSH